MQFRTLSYEFIRNRKLLHIRCKFTNDHPYYFCFKQTLNNLKWKCLRANVQPHRTDSNKDPVLLAYWKLLHEDILCSWRRVLSDDRQRTQRELWVFTTHEDLPTDLPNLQRENSSKATKSSIFFDF